MPTELGSFFNILPGGLPMSELGAYVGANSGSTNLSPDALKVHFARFDKFMPSDDTGIGFPYSALRTYQAQEVAAGRTPIFVTATYQGKKRPVIWSWSLGLNSANKPTTSSQNWRYAVNVGDSRFINYWVTKYVRPVILYPMRNMKDVWLFLDECSFNLNNFGVIDDSGTYVRGVTWDSPFPQGLSAYYASIETFFRTVQASYPDVHAMVDVGTMQDPTQFKALFASVPGAITENIYSWYTYPSSMDVFASQNFPLFSWLGSLGRIAILVGQFPSGNTVALRSCFVVYELLKGANFFFAPRALGANAEPPPSDWEGMDTKLGDPVSLYQAARQPGGGPGKSLFSRQYTRGYVYLNWTGGTQTVTLPAGHTWLDPNGSVVTRLTIPFKIGTYVTMK